MMLYDSQNHALRDPYLLPVDRQWLIMYVQSCRTSAARGLHRSTMLLHEYLTSDAKQEYVVLW